MTHRRCPAEGHENQERDLFRARLDEMIDMSHPLVRVSEAMPWETLIESVGESLPLVPVGPGRRPLPARLVLGLLYLKHAYDLSDEAVCARWLENPYYQYFCGEVFFQTQLPFDPSSLTRYRKRLGEAGVEELLSQTIEAAKLRPGGAETGDPGWALRPREAVQADAEGAAQAAYDPGPVATRHRSQGEPGGVGTAGADAVESRTSAQPDAERQKQTLRLARAGSGMHR